MHPGIWYAVIDLANALFTSPISKETWEQLAFSWKGRQFTFTCLTRGYIHGPTVCHQNMAEHLDSLLLASSAQLAHYIDDILLQGHTESQVHKALETCIQHES